MRLKPRWNGLRNTIFRSGDIPSYGRERSGWELGIGFDSLTIEDTTGRTNEALNVGATPGSGRHTLDGQTINFSGLEPFFSNAAIVNWNINVFPGLALVGRDMQLDLRGPQPSDFFRVELVGDAEASFVRKHRLCGR